MAEIDLKSLRHDQVEAKYKLRRSITELDLKTKMAELDLGIAQDELNDTTIRLRDKDGKSPVTPKEEARAQVTERQKYLDLLDARLQQMKAKVSYLRQSGQLDTWLSSTIHPPTLSPASTQNHAAH